ncbi:MAG: DUF2721 domain-containing protein [Cellulosilyticum sp.]|nr:DUF2721 domain-containing protein [Cellulosilyticum sp.]
MKREIVIDGSASDWFEKATFVLKESHQAEMPQDLMTYAEEIIENQMKRGTGWQIKKLPQVDFTHQPANEYQKARIAYNEQMKREYARLTKEKEALRKRARYVNTFVTLAIIACVLSLVALAISGLG